MTPQSEREQRLLSCLGLCKRAGKTVVGVPMVCEALRRGGKDMPVLVMEAADTSENTHKKLSDKCAFYGTRHVRLSCGGEALAHALGKSAVCGAVAITDAGMCKMLEQYL